MLRLLRNGRYHLNARGAGADDPDALACEVNAFMWPGTRVVNLAGEGFDARQVGQARDRQRARGHDAVLR